MGGLIAGERGRGDGGMVAADVDAGAVESVFGGGAGGAGFGEPSGVGGDSVKG